MFRFRVRLQNPKCGYQYQNPDFPIERTPKVCAWWSKIADCWWRWSIFFFRSDGSCTYVKTSTARILSLLSLAMYVLYSGGSDPGQISGSRWPRPPPPPPPDLKVWVCHCCMYCYVFKVLSEPDFKRNCWYSLFKVRLRPGFMRWRMYLA